MDCAGAETGATREWAAGAESNLPLSAILFLEKQDPLVGPNGEGGKSGEEEERREMKVCSDEQGSRVTLLFFDLGFFVGLF